MIRELGPLIVKFVENEVRNFLKRVGKCRWPLLYTCMARLRIEFDLVSRADLVCRSDICVPR